jgi:hypothetical protein
MDRCIVQKWEQLNSQHHDKVTLTLGSHAQISEELYRSRNQEIKKSIVQQESWRQGRPIPPVQTQSTTQKRSRSANDKSNVEAAKRSGKSYTNGKVVTGPMTKRKSNRTGAHVNNSNQQTIDQVCTPPRVVSKQNRNDPSLVESYNATAPTSPTGDLGNGVPTNEPFPVYRDSPPSGASFPPQMIQPYPFTHNAPNFPPQSVTNRSCVLEHGTRAQSRTRTVTPTGWCVSCCSHLVLALV